jgi:hypothetical protein
MTFFDYILIGLAILIPGGIPAYLIWRATQKKQREADEKLNESVDDLANALLEAAESMTGVSSVKTSPSGTKYKTAENKYLSDPTYLTTLLTTIVKKQGSLVLTEEDFIDVSSQDYISLYIDLKTNNIILRANQIGETEELSTYVSTTPESDEDVYH